MQGLLLDHDLDVLAYSVLHCLDLLLLLPLGNAYIVGKQLGLALGDHQF